MLAIFLLKSRKKNRQANELKDGSNNKGTATILYLVFDEVQIIKRLSLNVIFVVNDTQ